MKSFVSVLMALTAVCASAAAQGTWEPIRLPSISENNSCCFTSLRALMARKNLLRSRRWCLSTLWRRLCRGQWPGGASSINGC